MSTNPKIMRLSDFILDHMEAVLQAWETFAKTIEPPAFTMDSADLRDHASHMLKAIAADLRCSQTAVEQFEKSKGRGIRGLTDTAAEAHAAGRLDSGYTISQLVSEYRALRACVLRLWAKQAPTLDLDYLDDITRFNEAIDQALAESVSRFSQITAGLFDTERSRLDAVLTAVPVGIGLADATGKLVLTNPENQRIWGDHPLAENIEDYIEWKGWWADGSDKHGQLVTPHEWALARALSGEERPRDVVEIEPFDSPGARLTLVLHAVPIRDAIKDIVGAVVAQMDITGKVKAEAALRESEAKFRTIANAMPQMVWSTLPDGFHDYYNQQWYDFTGVPAGSTDGEAWNGMFHPDDRATAWAAWRHCLTTGETYEIQYRLRHHSGEYRWTLGRALPVRNDAGTIIRWMGTCTDIHDQKLAEEALIAANQRKDEFLAMLAHELRNPLAPISTAAQLLKIVGGDRNKVLDASEVIARQVKHMTALVDDLLDVSRVTRGLTELEKQDIDLAIIIHGAVEQARPLIEARHQILQLDISPLPAFVHADKTRLIQAIANLLNNASKYTPQSGQISLTLTVNAAEASIFVTDNGIGIPPSLLPVIFDLFTQGERTPDRGQGGLGLGLALVKSITTRHGGHIEANSEGTGMGSTFKMVLPLLTHDDAQRAETGPPHDVMHETKPVRLMIVDDNIDAAQSLALLLETMGHKVIIREDGQSALTAVESDPVQVLILDIGLPDMDGYTLARRVRAYPQTENATLIALTGYGQAHDRILSKTAGFDYHFVKPVDALQLTNILAQCT